METVAGNFFGTRTYISTTGMFAVALAEGNKTRSFLKELATVTVSQPNDQGI